MSIHLIIEKAIKRSEFDIKHNPDNIWKIIISMIHEIQESIKIDSMAQLPIRVKSIFTIQVNPEETKNVFINRLRQNNLLTNHVCSNDPVNGKHGMHQFCIDVFTKNHINQSQNPIPVEDYKLQVENIQHVHVHMRGFPCLCPDAHNNLLLYRLQNLYYCPISNSIHVCNIGTCNTTITRDGRICVVSGLITSQIYDVEELWSKGCFSDHRDWIPNSSDLNVDQQNKESVFYNILNNGSLENVRQIQLNISCADLTFGLKTTKCSKQTQFRSVSTHFNKWKNQSLNSSNNNQLDTIKSTQLDSMSGIDRFKQDSTEQKQELMPFTQTILSNVRDVKNGYNHLLNIAGKVVFDILFSDNRMRYVYKNNETILCEMSEKIYKYMTKNTKERKSICIMSVLDIYNRGVLSLDSYATRVKKLSQETIDNIVTYYAACVLQVYINVVTRTPDGCILSYNFTYYETFVAIIFLMRKHHCINIISLAEKVTKTALNDIYFKSQIDDNVTLIPSDDFIRNALPSLKFLDFININYNTISTIQNSIINTLSEALNTYKISPYMLEIPMLNINDIILSNNNIIEALIVRRCQQIVACARFIKESECIMLWDKLNFDTSMTIDKRNIIKQIMKCNNSKDNLPVEYIINCRKIVGPFGPPSVYMKLNVVKDKMVALRETSILNIPKGGGSQLCPLYQAAQKYLSSKPYVYKNLGDSSTDKRKTTQQEKDDSEYINLKDARDLIKVKKPTISDNDIFVKIVDTAPWL